MPKLTWIRRTWSNALNKYALSFVIFSWVYVLLYVSFKEVNTILKMSFLLPELA